MPHWAIIIDDGKPVNTTQKTICRLPISVGRMYYEGAALRDVLEAVKKTFSFCIIHIADTLQARTIKLTKPKEVEAKAKEIAIGKGVSFISLSSKERELLLEEASKVLAQQKGREWLERNKDIISEILGSRCKIDTWSDWTTHKLYPTYREAIEKQYYDNQKFKEAVDVAATNFIAVLNVELKQGIIPPFDPEIAGRENKEYIKEETTVVKLWQDEWAKSLSPQSDPEERRFVVVYPANTPAHRCMIECLNNLKVAEYFGIGSAALPMLEFFDVVFYCDRSDSNPVLGVKIYQVTSSRSSRKDRTATKQQSEQQFDTPTTLVSPQRFFATTALNVPVPQNLPRQVLESTVRTFQQQMLFFVTSVPPEETLETCRQMIRFAQELQASTRVRLKNGGQRDGEEQESQTQIQTVAQSTGNTCSV